MGRRKVSSTRGGIKNGGKIRYICWNTAVRLADVKSISDYSRNQSVILRLFKNKRQMLKSIIRTLLQKFIDDIDADNCNITMEQQSKIISVLSNIANPDQRMSKIQACDYIGVSRATFDNYVKDGFIPKGIKQEGFKELSWNKADLDIFLSSQN